MQSTNPALNSRVFSAGTDVLDRPFALQQPSRMTIEGTVAKTGVLLALVVAAAAFSWRMAGEGTLLLPGVGVAFFLLLALGLVTAFKPLWAVVTGPIYAVASGIVLGAISAIYEAQYGGIVGSAVIATLGTAGGVLFAYRVGALRATPRFRKVIITATLGILLMYVVSMVMRLFGATIPLLHDSSPLGIGVSVVIVTVAALNLVLDFDFIERASRSGADKRLEWYGGFAIMVTLVWLYLEMLRLLGKLRD